MKRIIVSITAAFSLLGIVGPVEAGLIPPKDASLFPQQEAPGFALALIGQSVGDDPGLTHHFSLGFLGFSW